MRVGFSVAALFLFAVLLSLSLPARCETGSTVINVTIPGSLNLSLAYPDVIVAEDYHFYENLTVWQNHPRGIYVYLNKSDSDNLVKFVNVTGGGTYYQNDYTLYLPAASAANVTVRTYVPPGQGFDGGTYNIPIYAYSLGDYRTNTTTLKINVNNTNPIDDINVEGIYPSSLYPGESLRADISIHKMYPPEMTDMQICYCINSNADYLCGPSYNNYGCEWKAITTLLNYSKTAAVNENAGTYYFIVAVKYPGDDVIKRANSPQLYVRTAPAAAPSGSPSGTMVSAAVPQPKLSITAPNYLEAAPGGMTGFTVEVKNTGSVIAHNTTLGVYGLPESWFYVSPSMQKIEADQSVNFSVSISLPKTAFEQVYSLSLIAKSGSAEAVKIVTFTVAADLNGSAAFLLGEAGSRKKETEGILARVMGLGIDVSVPEKNMTYVNAILDEAKTLFGLGNYSGTLEKSKQAIGGYGSVVAGAKLIVESQYSSLLQKVNSQLSGAEAASGETDVIKSIKEKINKGAVLREEERIIEAYETLLDAKRLLDQLTEKISIGETAGLILIFFAITLIAFVIIAFALYRKKVSKFVRKTRAEEQKKHLKRIFGKEVGPAYGEPSEVPVSPEEAERKRRISNKLENIISWIGLLALALFFILLVLAFLVMFR